VFENNLAKNPFSAYNLMVLGILLYNDEDVEKR